MEERWFFLKEVSMEDKYYELLKKLHPLKRTLVSEDSDKTMDILKDFLMDMGIAESQILLHEFPSGSEASTWVIPKKYELKDYSLVQLGREGRVIVDSTNIPLSVAEYSQSVNKTVGWEELKNHLFYSERRPKAIPFIFKFFYKPNWAFCISKDAYDSMNRKAKFRVRIDSNFTDGSLKCLEVVIPGETKNSILIISNVCHPYQVNDAITGVINNLMLIEHFMKRKNHYTLRFGFWPETIGSHAYFSKYIKEKSMFKYGIFTEMLGTPGNHALQFSRQENTLIDRASMYVLKSRNLKFCTGRFTTLLRNDERVSNGPNLDIPTISLSRWPYEEYHTSDDEPSIINMDNLRESSDITREIIEIVDGDMTLVPGDFFGQPFLTKFGLYYDRHWTRNQGVGPVGHDFFRNWKADTAKHNLNKIIEDIFSYSDGTMSLFDITSRFNYPWGVVKELADGLIKNNLYFPSTGSAGNNDPQMGVDCISVSRFDKKTILNEKFMKNTFTENEINYCSGKADPAQYFAGRFAAKEAIIKALSGYGVTLGFPQIEILNSERGAPFANTRVDEDFDIKITISHCQDVAVAVALVKVRKV